MIQIVMSVLNLKKGSAEDEREISKRMFKNNSKSKKTKRI